MLNATHLLPVHRIVQEHIASVHDLLLAIDGEAIAQAVELLEEARRASGTIFVAGNGGSAATASHLANDLGKATRSSLKPPVRVQGLSDNTPWITALANDEGYDRVFAGQLENFARAGDVLIVISASGNSPNLIAAVECAMAKAVPTIALLGFDGGVLRGMVDVPLWLSSDHGAYASIEDAHSVLCHAITLCLCAS